MKENILLGILVGVILILAGSVTLGYSIPVMWTGINGSLAFKEYWVGATSSGFGLMAVIFGFFAGLRNIRSKHAEN